MEFMVQPTQSVYTGWAFFRIFFQIIKQNYDVIAKCCIKGRKYIMLFYGLFKKRISIKQGKKLLTQYCKENGFDDTTTQWKETTFAKHWFAYRKHSNKIISSNWVSYHYIRAKRKYSIWIDLITGEIRETLR